MKDPTILFRALADETRLQMLALIRENGELCVCDLENVLEITQSKASRHLRYLDNAGLVRDRREAVWIYYRIADDLNPAQRAVLNTIPEIVSQDKLAELRRKLNAWLEQKSCGVARVRSSAPVKAVEAHS